ncbi:MAG TPA: alpha/beta hydrolase-fold protein [Gemmatimonadaceae bacterium]
MASLTDFIRRLRGRSSAAYGTIERIPAVYSPQLDNERELLVSLPAHYESKESRYPVIYMHDGQNLFDPAMSFSGSWNVDVAMAELSLGGLEAIVVGIPNMGHERIAEYSPFEQTEVGEGRGDLYLDFLINTVKPLIDARYFTLPDREHTGIVGSSLGGLISLYAFFRYPRVFGFAGVLSPSLWLNHGAIFSFIEQAPFSPGKLYLDVGDREGPRHVANAKEMRDLLEAKGYRPGRDLLWVEEEMGHHHEAAWARRFQAALPFLVPPAEPEHSDRIARLIARTTGSANITESSEHAVSRFQRMRSKGK